MEFVRPKKPALSFNMAPLIDIVFLLVIFFMLSSSFLNPALKLTLPHAAAHDQQESEQVVVSIDQAGAIYVNARRIPEDRLKGELETRLAASKDKSVHLRGDRDMPYHLFVHVMDLARQAGARQVNIVHESSEMK